MNAKQLKARYEIDYKWRAAWQQFANQCIDTNRQDKALLRRDIANNRIKKIFNEFDNLKAN